MEITRSNAINFKPSFMEIPQLPIILFFIYIVSKNVRKKPNKSSNIFFDEEQHMVK